MDDVLSRQMYQENILEHYKKPQNFGHLAKPTHLYHSHNPLCGDDLTIEIAVVDGKVSDVRFSGVGCAISVASASMLTDEIKGKSVEAVMQMTKDDVLELLQIPIGPVRLKCALLSLETVQKAVGGGE